jgi:hypothetical protein
MHGNIRGSAPVTVRYPLLSRGLIVLIALAVLCWRVPNYFTDPQFWAEDGLAWLQTHIAGARSLVMPMAGYQLLAMHMITLFAEQFPTAAAPAIYFYSTVFITLWTVWLVMSPRFDIPYRPLAALAVVASYQGNYVFGGIANLQWVLPIAACAIILMRPHSSKLVLLGEALFLAAVSVTGTFSVFLLAAILSTTVLSRPDSRRVIFLAIVSTGAVLQIASMLMNIDATLVAGEHVKQPLDIIVNMPFRKLFSPFGRAIFNGSAGVIATSLLTVVTIWCLLLPKFRTEKTFIVVFAAALIAGSVFKSGVDLDETYGLRYFYIPSVLAVWFLAFTAPSIKRHAVLAAMIGAYQIATIYLSFNTALTKSPHDWASWARAIDTGLPVTVPISPPPWSLNVPATPNKTYSHLNAWIGRPLGTVAVESCPGSISEITQLIEPHFGNVPGIFEYQGSLPRWQIRGESTAGQVVAIADDENRVLGFGHFGFGGQQSWLAIVPAVAGSTIHALRVDENGVCPVATKSVPSP